MFEVNFNVFHRNEKDKDGRHMVLYGVTEGKICKECAMLSVDKYAKNYYRCALNEHKNFKISTVACCYFKQRQ